MNEDNVQSSVGVRKYPTPIHEKVARANAGELSSAVIRLRSGWVVMADTQPVEGYCLLFADPVVSHLNALSEEGRALFMIDAARVGDALRATLGADRINYEIWGNQDRALHCHIVPRYLSEEPSKAVLPICKGYDTANARKFDVAKDNLFILKMRTTLKKFALEIG